MGRKHKENNETTTIPCSVDTYNELFQIKARLTQEKARSTQENKCFVSWDEVLTYVLKTSTKLRNIK